MKKLLISLLLIFAVTSAYGQAIELSWTANTEPDFSHYKIYRGPEVGNLSLLADNVVGTSYIDSTVSWGATYRYAISAVDNSGNESDMTTPQSMEVVDVISPASITPTITAGEETNTLNWDPPVGATDINYYKVYGGTTSGSLSLLQDNILSTSFVHTSLTAGTPYYYEVTAVDWTGNEGDPASEVSSTPLAIVIPTFSFSMAPTDSTAGGNVTVSGLGIASESPILLEWKARAVQDGTPTALWSAISASSMSSADVEFSVTSNLSETTSDLSAATDSLEISIRVGDTDSNFSDWTFYAIAFERQEAPPVYTIDVASYDSDGPGGNLRVLMDVSTDKDADIHMAWRWGYDGVLSNVVEADGLTTSLYGIWETETTVAAADGDTLHYLAYNGSDVLQAHTTQLVTSGGDVTPPSAPTSLTSTIGDFTEPEAPTNLTSTIGGS